MWEPGDRTLRLPCGSEVLGQESFSQTELYREQGLAAGALPLQVCGWGHCSGSELADWLPQRRGCRQCWRGRRLASPCLLIGRCVVAPARQSCTAPGPPLSVSGVP